MTIQHNPVEHVKNESDPVKSDPAVTRGVDRRTFMLLSLAATGAGALGVDTARAQGAGATPQQQPPPVPLGNGEAPALQFQPYPGGTGAMMEKLARERGRAAFERSEFVVEPWRAAVPTSADELAFLPAHRLAALIKARKVTSAQLTDIYLTRLKHSILHSCAR